jgi:hypothetical protein
MISISAPDKSLSLENLHRLVLGRTTAADPVTGVAQRLGHEILTGERIALIGLRNDGTIGTKSCINRGNNSM